MKHKIIFVIVFLFLCGQAWADVDTLRPTGDRAYMEWTDYPDAGDDYEKIDEVTSDGDATYLWAKTTAFRQGWSHTDWTTSDNIDSVRLTVRARSPATTGTREIILTRFSYGGEFWGPCLSDRDTVTLTSSYVDYSITWSQDPCDEASWDTTKLNNNSRAWGWDNYAVGLVVDTIREDNFNDNSLDGDFWVESCEGQDGGCNSCAGGGCPNNELLEQNNRLESLPYDNAHCGAWVVSDSSAYVKNKIYIWEFTWYASCIYGGSPNCLGYGFDGFFIMPKSWAEDTRYGYPNDDEVFFRLGSGCSYDENGIGIHASNDWVSCAMETTVAENTNNFIEKETWYDVRIYFNGSTGLCSLAVDDSIVTGTLTSPYLTALGDSIKFIWGSSYWGNDTENKEDYMDDFYMRTEETADNRVTQSFVEVFYQEAVAEGQVIIVH